jgi:hypothetical protein
LWERGGMESRHAVGRSGSFLAMENLRLKLSSRSPRSHENVRQNVHSSSKFEERGERLVASSALFGAHHVAGACLVKDTATPSSVHFDIYIYIQGTPARESRGRASRRVKSQYKNIQNARLVMEVPRGARYDNASPPTAPPENALHTCKRGTISAPNDAGVVASFTHPSSRCCCC